MADRTALPERLQEIVDEFAATPVSMRAETLLDYADGLPPLPVGTDRGMLEQVHECQTPLFVAAGIEDGQVRLHFDAPAEAPTTRGFAGILHAGLDGATADDVLGVPDDFAIRMGLAEVISPLRLRGMAAMLARVKRQVRIRAGTV